MKADERALIESLLAPVSTLTTLLAPLGELPGALRALAGATPVKADTAQTVAEIAGLDPVAGEDLESVVRRVIDTAWKGGIAHARANALLAGPPAAEVAREAREALVREVLDNGVCKDAPAQRLGTALVERRLAGQDEGGAWTRAGLAEQARALGLVIPEDADVQAAIMAAVRDGLEVGASLREVRERAAQGALLALLDEVAPGARHDRPSGSLGAKVEDLPAAELRAVIARRFASEICEVEVTTDLDEMTAMRSQLADVILERDDARANLAAVDAVLRAAAQDESATTCEMAQQLAESVRSERNEVATLSHQIDGADKDLDALAAARETAAQLDRILRPAVAAAGLAVEDTTVIELAELLVLYASAIPRSARDGARKEQREILAALGLGLEIDRLSVPGARAEIVRAIQASASGDRVAEQIHEELREVAIVLRGVCPDAPEYEPLIAIAQLVADRARSVEVASVGPKTAARQALQRVADALEIGRALESMSVESAVHELVEGVRALLTKSAQDGAPVALDLGALYEQPIATAIRDDQGAIYAVWSACQSLKVELPEGATVIQACDVLGVKLDALATWTRLTLPQARLWDRQIVEDCPLDVPDLDKPSRGTSAQTLGRTDDDDDLWEQLARDVKAVAEGDDVDGLATWIATGKDARVVLQAMLDRVVHQESQVEEHVEQSSGRVDATSPYPEELARHLFERLPLGVDAQLVVRCVADLEQVTTEPLVNGTRALLRGAADRALETRDLEAWCALDPKVRNRLIDRTREALAATERSNSPGLSGLS